MMTKLNKALESINTVEYGKTSTYTFTLDKERLDYLCGAVNRSSGQMQFLFQLVGRDYSKLELLEEQIKNCFVSYCPNNVKEVDEVLLMTPRSNYFKLNFKEYLSNQNL